MMRLRITFAKQGALRYIGHLDLNKIWERTARRADLPLAYSQGFHPQPKIYLASALPLGFSSRCELVDMRLKDEIDLEGLRERLQGAVPPGLEILEVKEVDEALPQLQTQLIAAEYEVFFTEPVDASDLNDWVAGLLSAESLPRERRGKPYDLRPLIEEISITPIPFAKHLRGVPIDNGEICLKMRLTSREGATGRPEEVLDQIGIPMESTRIERTRLIFQDSPVQ
jgi:radical SAM-linked protein